MQYPYAEIEFTSRGALHAVAQQDAALEQLRREGPSDVLLLVHGWNNDIVASRRLYERLADSIAASVDHVPGAAARRLAVVGVLWPSIRWADEDEVAGGGVGLLTEEAALQAAIGASVDDRARAEQLEALVSDLERSAAARQRFLELLREQLPDPVPGDEDPPPSPLLEGDAEQVFDEVGGPDVDLLGGDEGAAGPLGGATLGGAPMPGGTAPVGEGEVGDLPGAGSGGAAGVGLGSVVRSARSLLNLTTYYTMKARAGAVGAHGVADLVAAIADAAPNARRHLVGHSFGARVVASAVAHGTVSVHSLTLLQGAFSHHGLANDYDGRGGSGRFRAILDPEPRTTGPILVTHTANDRAVGVAYAIASRLARQQASGLGGPNDRYGGIGRNGALRTPEVEPAGDLHDVGEPYRFAAGKVHNLRSDRYIASHSAVTGPQVGYALLAAITGD
jgi:hypothetical protein